MKDGDFHVFYHMRHFSWLIVSEGAILNTYAQRFDEIFSIIVAYNESECSHAHINLLECSFIRFQPTAVNCGSFVM